MKKIIVIIIASMMLLLISSLAINATFKYFDCDNVEVNSYNDTKTVFTASDINAADITKVLIKGGVSNVFCRIGNLKVIKPYIQ